MVAREGVQQPAIRERLISPLLRSCGCGLQGRPRERRRHARRPGMHHKEEHTYTFLYGKPVRVLHPVSGFTSFN